MTEASSATAGYGLAGPPGLVLETTVGGVLRDAAERAAETIAVVEGIADRRERRRWSYADLLADAERVARALLGRFAPCERVAVWAPNCPEWLLLEFGAALAGLTLVTVNPALRAREVAHVLGQSRAHGVVLAPSYRGADLAGTLAQVRGGLPGLREVISLADWESFAGSGSAAERLPWVSPDDAVQIQYTSGTTGFPKGAVLRHRGITNNARFCAQILQAEPGEAWVNPMPERGHADESLASVGSAGDSLRLGKWGRCLGRRAQMVLGGLPSGGAAGRGHGRRWCWLPGDRWWDLSCRLVESGAQ